MHRRRLWARTIHTLAADVIALIDQLGGQVDLVGHDWGGAITYAVCASSPARVRRAVTLAIPHPATFLRSLAYSRQWRRSWYMGLFQLPGAGHLVRARDSRLDRSAVARLVAGLHARSCPARRASRLPRREPPRTTRVLPCDPPPAVDARRSPAARRGEDHAAAAPAPWCRRDGCIVAPTAVDERWFADRVLEIVPNVGHFLHAEQPAPIAARVTSWLA